jgi:hypothetical protein
MREPRLSNSVQDEHLFRICGDSRILRDLFEEQSCPTNLKLQIPRCQGSNKTFVRPHGLERAEGHAAGDSQLECALPAHAWWIAVSISCNGGPSLDRPQRPSPAIPLSCKPSWRMCGAPPRRAARRDARQSLRSYQMVWRQRVSAHRPVWTGDAAAHRTAGRAICSVLWQRGKSHFLMSGNATNRELAGSGAEQPKFRASRQRAPYQSQIRLPLRSTIE